MQFDVTLMLKHLKAFIVFPGYEIDSRNTTGRQVSLKKRNTV